MEKKLRPHLCSRHANQKPGRTGFAAVASLAAVLLGPLTARVHAQAPATTWNGTTSAWAADTNWSAGVPTASTVAAFNGPFANQPVLSANQSAGALFVNNGAGQSVTITGVTTTRTLTLAGNLTVAGSDGTLYQNTAILLDGNSNYGLTLGTLVSLTLSNSTNFYVNNAATLSVGAITLGANTLTLRGTNASGITNINGVIASTTAGNGLTVNTAGTVVLSGANTFNGTTTLTAGTLRATTSASALGAGTLSLGGGELQLANATALSFGRNTTVTANTQITSDVLTAGGAGVSHTLGTLSIGAQTLTVAGGANVASGTAGVTFGATTLTGAATFNVLNPAAGGATTLTLGAIAGANTFTFTLKGNGNFVGAGVIAGSGGITLDSTYTGTARLNAANTYSGATAVNGGTLVMGATGGFSSSSTYTVTSGGTLNGSTFTSGLGGLSVQGGLVTGTGSLNSLTAVDAQSGTISAILGGTNGLTKTTGGTVTLSGANAYTGVTTLNAGILRATTSTAALGAGTLTLNGGELQLANTTGLNFARNTTVAGNAQITSDVLTAGGAGVSHTLGTLSIGAQTLTVAGGANVASGTAGVTFGATTLTGNAIFNVTNPANGGGTTLTFNNAIGGGTNTFTKTGNGTLLFTGNTSTAQPNTYTGLTTVSGGELDLSKPNVANNTVISIAGDARVTNATIKLLASGQFATTSNVTVDQGGTFNLNAFAATVNSLTLTGPVVIWRRSTWAIRWARRR